MHTGTHWAAVTDRLSYSLQRGRRIVIRLIPRLAASKVAYESRHSGRAYFFFKDGVLFPVDLPKSKSFVDTYRRTISDIDIDLSIRMTLTTSLSHNLLQQLRCETPASEFG